MREVIEALDRDGRGIVLAVDRAAGGRLVGCATDGDVRRAILACLKPEAPLRDFMHRDPVTARPATERPVLLALMQRHAIRQLPVVDHDGRPVNLVTLDELAVPPPLSLPAVVMAGGRGTRLRPLTDTLPKALVPVAGMPMVERVVRRLAAAGVQEVVVVTQHRASEVEQHLGDGARLGVALRYLREEAPLGTAGALALLADTLPSPFLVMNCDILTSVNLADMLAFHTREQADLTVAVKPYQVQVPFGVVEMQAGRITGVSEKPVLDFFINAGIYLVTTGACRLIPRSQRYDMTDLVASLAAAGGSVVGFPLHEYWLDLGHPGELQRGEDDLRQGQLR